MGDNPFTPERFAFFNQANRIAAENNMPIFFPGKTHNPKPHDPRGGGQGGGNEHGGGGGGGGGGYYTAAAVHLDGNTWLGCASLSCSDTTKLSVVGWLKVDALAPETFNGSPLFVVDPEVNYSPLLGFGKNDDSIAENAYYISDFSINDATYDNDESANSIYAAIPNAAWACLILSIDTAGGFGIGKLYVGDEDTTNHVGDIGSRDGSAPFNIAMNGRPIFFASDAENLPPVPALVGDFADWRIMPGISLLDGGGDIPLATRRLFIDGNGKPVDPAVATASLGAAGAVLLSGNASTFASNQGTGGTFSVTAGSLTNASTSPSD